MHAVVWLLLITSAFCSAQCPRRLRSNENGADGLNARNSDGKSKKVDAKAPGSAPTQVSMNCIYLHRDPNDAHFRQLMKQVLDEIIKRLYQQLRVNIKLEKVDCSKADHVKCGAYSIPETFHWLIIKDLSHDEAVYDLNKTLNINKPTIEASILDALSRHSDHDLTEYCSEETDRIVGFIRLLSKEELMSKKSKKGVQKWRPPLVNRSPLELNMLEPYLLELLSVQQDALDWRDLHKFDENLLHQTIKTKRLTFVLFVHKDDPVSVHAFMIWSLSSSKLSEKFGESASFGAIDCEEEEDMCEQYTLKPKDRFAIFAYDSDGMVAKTDDFRDANYYIQWVTLLLNAPAIVLENEDDLKKAKQGLLPNFDDIQPAITIGTFNSIDSEEAKIFLTLANDLKGKYYFAYQINPSATNRVYIVRPGELKKRVDWTEEVFDLDSLNSFVVRWSLPSVIDIAHGFTSNILLHQAHTVLLLVTTNGNIQKAFKKLCSDSSVAICATFIDLKSHAVHQMLKSLGIQEDAQSLSKFIVFAKENIYIADVSEKLESMKLMEVIASSLVGAPEANIALDDVHPLRYLQLGQIDHIFGKQEIKLPTEVELMKRAFDDKMTDTSEENDEDGNYGGCPVMAKMKKATEAAAAHQEL